MSLIASFMNLAGPDLIVILLIVLVLFGAKKLPELARGMGQAVKEFQKAKDEFNDELHKAGKSETETAKSDLKPVQSTVPRSESQPASTDGKLIKRKEPSSQGKATLRARAHSQVSVEQSGCRLRFSHEVLSECDESSDRALGTIRRINRIALLHV
jgi:sec-independent protein translocase protein TatA